MGIFTGQINVNEALSYINTEFLSKIKEGMVITKDYALDLGARYSQYAIAVDAIKIITFFILFWVAIYVTIRLFKRCRHKDRTVRPNSYNDSDGARWLLFALSLIAPIGFLVSTISNSMDLVKRKFVPEVQMYQVIMDIKNGNTSNDGN